MKAAVAQHKKALVGDGLSLGDKATPCHIRLPDDEDGMDLLTP